MDVLQDSPCSMVGAVTLKKKNKKKLAEPLILNQNSSNLSSHQKKK